MAPRKSGSGSNPAPVSENAHKLASLISMKSIKHTLSEVSVGMGKVVDKKQKEQEKDPDQLIHDFDDKLAEIQAMLNAYKEEVAQEEETMAARARAHQRGGRGTGRPLTREERKARERVVTEAEAYMNEKIQRRVQSAGPGASRALSEKVHAYRTNAVARAELNERCRQHEKWKEEQEAKIRAARSGTFDFIKANQISLRDDPQPYLSKVMSVSPAWANLSLRPGTAPVGGLSGSGSLRPTSVPTGAAAASGHLGSSWGTTSIASTGGRVPLPSMSTAGGGASGSGTAAAPAATVMRSRRTSSMGDALSGLGGLAGGPGYASVHFAAERSSAGPLGSLGGFHSYFRPSAPLGSAATSCNGAAPMSVRSVRVSPPRGVVGDTGAFSSRSGARPESAAASLAGSFAGAASLRHASPPGFRPPSRAAAGSGGGGALGEEGPSSPNSVHGSVHSTMRARFDSALVGGGQDGEDWDREDASGEEGEPVGIDPWTGVLLGTRPASPEVLAAERELRIKLTARPASGGSPTRRSDFVVARQLIAAKQREHAEAVKARRREIEAYRRNKKEIEAEMRARREEEEARARAEHQAAMELMQRHRAWLGISALAHKLVFLRSCIATDRDVRPLRALRKEAAVRIATWYKRVLLRRRQRELTELILRLRRVLRPHLARKKEEVRTLCAERIVHFLQHCQGGSAESAIVAVRTFKERLIFIQQSWRTMVMVRKMQRAVLYQYFTRFERSVVKKNMAEVQAAEAAGRQRIPARVGGGISRKSIAATSMAAPSVAGDKLVPHGGEDVLGASITSHTMASGGGRPGSPEHQLTAGRGAKRMMAEIEDPVLEAEIAAHKEMLPKEIRIKVVEEAVLDIRRKFYKQLAGYRAALEVYEAQRPIEELRMKLLSEAGLDAVPQLRKPVQPRMHVLLPRPALKRLLQTGIRALEEHKAAGLAARRALAEKLWAERQAARAAIGGEEDLEVGSSLPPDPDALERLLEADGSGAGGGGWDAKSRPMSAKSYKSTKSMAISLLRGPSASPSRHTCRSPTRKSKR